MDIYDMPQPEKFDMFAYDQIASFAPRLRESSPDGSLNDVADSMEAQRPTVLAAAIYGDTPAPGDKYPGIMQLVKWNTDIWEYGVCGFTPYKDFIDTDDTSVQSAWACIAQFTNKSRKAGAKILLIRDSLPKP